MEHYFLKCAQSPIIEKDGYLMIVVGFIYKNLIARTAIIHTKFIS
jgi:hypothetical protein